MEISRRIIDYALWYYLRYYPSQNKLRRKLNQKFWPASEKWKKYGWIKENEIDYIIEEKLRNIIQEEEVIKSKIKNYIWKNKNLNYIKGKLREKLFDKDVVEELLISEFIVEWESLMEEDYLRRQVVILKRKWKSKMYIKQKFIERSEDRGMVEKVIEEIYNEGEIEEIKLEYKKIKDRYDNFKIIEKLLRKWFNYAEVKQVVNSDK